MRHISDSVGSREKNSPSLHSAASTALGCLACLKLTGLYAAHYPRVLAVLCR